jgi:flagellar protein FlgJ
VAKVKRAAQEFEAIVLGQMLKTMRQASATGPLLLGGTSQKLYRDLMDDELAKALARKGGVGLADVLARDLLRLGPGPKKALKSPEPPADSRPVGSEPSEGATP